MSKEKDLNLAEFQNKLHRLKKEISKDYSESIYNPISRALHLAEEAGELARVERLALEGFQFKKEKAADAIGDIMISVLAYCISRNWSAQTILKQSLDHIEKRWTSGQLNGIGDEDIISAKCKYCNTNISVRVEDRGRNLYLGECMKCKVARDTEQWNITIESESTKKIKNPFFFPDD